MRLIDADSLYEKTAEWEAQALHMCEVHTNDEDSSEWKRWTAILGERTAFKHDIADAPTVDVANHIELVEMIKKAKEYGIANGYTAECIADAIIDIVMDYNW